MIEASKASNLLQKKKCIARGPAILALESIE